MSKYLMRKHRIRLLNIVITRLNPILLPLDFQVKGDTLVQKREEILHVIRLGRDGWNEWLHLEPILGVCSLLILQHRHLDTRWPRTARDEIILSDPIQCGWLDCHWMAGAGLLLSGQTQADYGQLYRDGELFGCFWRASNDDEAVKLGDDLAALFTSVALPALAELDTSQKLQKRLYANEMDYQSKYHHASGNSFDLEILTMALDSVTPDLSQITRHKPELPAHKN